MGPFIHFKMYKVVTFVLSFTVIAIYSFKLEANEPSTRKEGCIVPSWRGDNYCDDGNNNEGCDYDGGDCCGSNVNKTYCQNCQCLDPTNIVTSICQVGFTGHNCEIKLDDEAECQYDHDCPESQFCHPHTAGEPIKTKCRNPCLYACGYGAACEAVDHKAICTCGSQWSGNPDPYVSCLSGEDGCSSYKILNDSSRNSIYVGPQKSRDYSTSSLKADWKGPSWYRFSLPAGTMMAKQPPTDSCGSGWGGWVYGDHPATNGEIVRRSVCFKGFGKTKCLPGFWTYHYLQENILIKNCGNFFAYFLTDTSGSWLARYCGGY